MSPVAAYERFYANTFYDAKGAPVIPHGHTINARFEELKGLILEAAGASEDPQMKAAAKLVEQKESLPSVHTSEAKASAIVGFQDWYGLQPEDQYSEREAIEVYELHLKESNQGTESLPAAKEVVAKSISVTDQVRAINYLQGQLARQPADSDKLFGWFAPSLAQSFKEKGVLELRQLTGYISTHGRFWHKSIKGLGSGRAERIVGWLDDHAETLKTIVTRAEKNWHPALPLERDIQPLEQVSTMVTLVYQSNDGVASPENSGLTLRTGFAPFELITVPRLLDGRNGMFRCSAPNAWGAKDDMDAVRVWLKTYLVAGKARTFDAYRREAERFLGWLYYVRNCALSSVSLSHALGYQAFLMQIDAKYISTARVTRGDVRWRPFRGQLTKGSQNYALGVLNQMFGALHTAGYLTVNPFADVKAHPDAKAALVFDATRSLGSDDLLLVRSALDTLPGLTSTKLEDQALARRTRLILHILLTTGMRRQELATTRLSSVVRAVMPGAAELVFKVIGKGTKERRIPVSAKLLEMVNEHHADWRELHQAHASRLGAFNADPPLVAVLEAPLRSETRYVTDDTVLAHDNAALSSAGIYQTLKTFFRQVSKSQPDPFVKARILNVSTHWMRHTFAHEVLEKAPPRTALVLTQELLGHASIATTANYLKQNDKAKVDTMKLVDPLAMNQMSSTG
jgi:site-specific recombinase XerD